MHGRGQPTAQPATSRPGDRHSRRDHSAGSRPKGPRCSRGLSAGKQPRRRRRAWHGISARSLGFQARSPDGRERASSFTAPSVPGTLQPRLAVGPVNDPLERQADSVADQVMRMPDPEFSVSAGSPQISRKCTACEEDEKTLRTKRELTPEPETGEALEQVHEVLRSPGHSLDSSILGYFEPRFGHDFSGVRVHADDAATTSARAIGALAYTVGGHIVFDANRWSPDSDEGKRLLAHELTHTIQQQVGDRPGAATGRQDGQHGRPSAGEHSLAPQNVIQRDDADDFGASANAPGTPGGVVRRNSRRRIEANG